MEVSGKGKIFNKIRGMGKYFNIALNPYQYLEDNLHFFERKEMEKRINFEKTPEAKEKERERYLKNALKERQELDKDMEYANEYFWIEDMLSLRENMGSLKKKSILAAATACLILTFNSQSEINDGYLLANTVNPETMVVLKNNEGGVENENTRGGLYVERTGNKKISNSINRSSF